MSKGLGRRQTQILDAVASDADGWLELRTLATTRSEYNALHRAARELEAAGLVTIDHRGHGLTVCKPGVRPLDTPKWLRSGVPKRNGATTRKR